MNGPRRKSLPKGFHALLALQRVNHGQVRIHNWRPAIILDDCTFTIKRLLIPPNISFQTNSLSNNQKIEVARG